MCVQGWDLKNNTHLIQIHSAYLHLAEDSVQGLVTQSAQGYVLGLALGLAQDEVLGLALEVAQDLASRSAHEESALDSGLGEGGHSYHLLAATKSSFSLV